MYSIQTSFCDDFNPLDPPRWVSPYEKQHRKLNSKSERWSTVAGLVVEHAIRHVGSSDGYRRSVNPRAGRCACRQGDLLYRRKIEIHSSLVQDTCRTSSACHVSGTRTCAGWKHRRVEEDEDCEGAVAVRVSTKGHEGRNARVVRFFFQGSSNVLPTVAANEVIIA